MGLDNLQYDEVDFERTGLAAVICQLRFDPLLRISHETPIQFQELLRDDFPEFGFRSESIDIQIATGGQIMKPAEAPQAEPSVWLLTARDEKWTVALGSNSLSLETAAYQNFADFSRRLDQVLNALEETYPAIDTFRRVGLRYVNVFTEADFPGGNWLDKLNPNLMGPMADEQIGDSVVRARQQFVIEESNWTITVNHGSGQGDAYRLDLDHATVSDVPRTEVREILREFNRHLDLVFRWSISEEMYHAMGPRPRA